MPRPSSWNFCCLDIWPRSAPALEIIRRAASNVGVMYRSSGPFTGSNPGGWQILKKPLLNILQVWCIIRPGWACYLNKKVDQIWTLKINLKSSFKVIPNAKQICQIFENCSFENARDLPSLLKWCLVSFHKLCSYRYPKDVGNKVNLETHQSAFLDRGLGCSYAQLWIHPKTKVLNC